MKLEFENIEEMINFLSGLGYTIIKNGEPWMPYNPYPCVPYYPYQPWFISNTEKQNYNLQ